jgi:hypothetical protein
MKKSVRVGIRRCNPDFAVLESLAASTQLLQATLTKMVYAYSYIRFAVF